MERENRKNPRHSIEQPGDRTPYMCFHSLVIVVRATVASLCYLSISHSISQVRFSLKNIEGNTHNGWSLDLGPGSSKDDGADVLCVI